jgi:putative transposase
MRHEGRVENRAVYVAVGIKLNGLKDVLGLWTGNAEGAKFWLTILTELKNRGMKDVFIACVDGLTGFPEAIETVFPMTIVQLCIVHMVRNSLNYVNWKERKFVAADLRAVYTAPTAEAAQQELRRFGEKWDKKYGSIRSLWERHWERIIPFFAFTPEIRKVMYTTNAIESLNMSLRKIIKTRGSFPSEQAALKLLYMALKNVVAKWQRNGVKGWYEALNQFTLLWGDRIRAVVRT